MRVLVVISGLPGTGKSAVAHGVAVTIGGVHLSVDPVEDALLGAGLRRGWETGVGAYEAVRTMAEVNLALGRDVVVDAVNDSESARDTWRRAASSTGVDLRFVLLQLADVDEHRRRVEERNRGFAHVVDPSWERVLERADSYEAWIGPHVAVDASPPVSEVVSTIVAALADL